MNELSITAEKRDAIGKKVKQIRAGGKVPGVIYGPKTEALAIALDSRELTSVLVEAGGTSLIDVHVGKDTHQILVRDVQRDFIRGDLLHVDFYAVDVTQVTQVEVPIILVGESSVVASRTGVLLQNLTSVLVEGLPQDLVSEITVDLDDLTEIGMSVLVGDLYVPSTLTILTDPADMVIKTDYLAIEEVEEVVEDEESMFAEDAEPEVIGKGKTDEEDEEEDE